MSSNEVVFSKSDAGAGKLGDYRFNLVPKNRRVTLTLAGSDDAQDEIARVASNDDLQAFISPRTAEEERTDAPIPVRFFVDQRMTGVVGWVPRGFEAVVIETLSRLSDVGKNRIPAQVKRTRKGLRVILRVGETR